jgi:predicted patatin/cPLA2 family phospholipase
MKHSVIKNLEKRMGMSAPFNDGRKIGLVLPGGMMTGVNGAGAMCALEALGLTQAFDVVYTASAGFANASYLLSQNTEIGSTIYYEEFSGKNFIDFWKFWQPVNYDWAVKSVRNIKPVDRDKIWALATDFVLRLSNYSDAHKKRIYLHIKEHNKEEYFDLFRAAISQPLVTRCTKIDFKKLCDGHLTNRDLIDQIKYALASDCTDLLIIYNHMGQVGLYDLDSSERYFEVVPTQDSRISLFETRGDVLKKAHRAMKEQILDIFKQREEQV